MSPERRSPRDEPESSSSAAIGRAIKLVRTGRDIGRRELAALAGLSYSYLSEIENGSKQPSTKALAAIADALDLPVYELMATAETWRESSELAEFHESLPETTRTLRRLMSQDEAPRAAEPPRSRDRFTTLLGQRVGRRSRGTPSTESERISELVGLFTDLSPEDQERVLDMVRRLAFEE